MLYKLKTEIQRKRAKIVYLIETSFLKLIIIIWRLQLNMGGVVPLNVYASASTKPHP